MTEHPHTTEGDIECSCNPLRLTVAGDGSISRIAGGPLDEPIDTGAAPRAEGPLRSALERLLAVAMTEEEDVSAATQDEWIAAIKQANEALSGRPSDEPAA